MTVADVLSGAATWHIEQTDVLSGLRALPDEPTKGGQTVTDTHDTSGGPEGWMSAERLRAIRVDLGLLEMPPDMRPSNSVEWAVARIRDLITALDTARRERDEAREREGKLREALLNMTDYAWVYLQVNPEGKLPKELAVVQQEYDEAKALLSDSAAREGEG